LFRGFWRFGGLAVSSRGSAPERARIRPRRARLLQAFHGWRAQTRPRRTAPPPAGLDIRTGFPVTSVRHGPAGAVLSGPSGAQLRARRVIVTAPLRVLQSGRIEFTPDLPQAKRDAIRRLRMGNAVKASPAPRRRLCSNASEFRTS
jgi:hypothetical protein